MTQQGLRQASARNLSGFATETNYNEDFLRLFDASDVPAGTFNERQLRWINDRMGGSYTNLNDAMQAYAAGQGFYNWSSMGVLENTANFTLGMPAGSTYTRTGAATGIALNLTPEEFAADIPQQTDRGLVLELAATNSLSNNVAGGAVVGEPGTLPTGWVANQGGLTYTVTGVGAEDGIDYVEVRFSGTTSGVLFNLRFCGDTEVAALVDQIWNGSVYVRLVGGSLTNVTTIDVHLLERSAVGISLARDGTVFVPTSAALKTQRYQHTRTFTIPTTAFAQAAVLATCGAGVAIDMTLRIGWPQLERNAMTSPIITAGAAVTRGLPIFTEAVPPDRTKALLTYADATTTLVETLTPSDTFDYTDTVITAGKGAYGVSELVSRVWQP
jgi:hypothetical protein